MTTRTHLPYDYARCPGGGDKLCENCARQVFNKPEHCATLWQAWTEPQIENGRCRLFIDMEYSDD